ncbi:hypothetical protein GCM10009827_015810 [Dactylosporangium maewongense]|uniref:Uncharacterized protein n=1 Tax=Dactylosporangium maewongense TaxID=634393 RepID=A0ABP4KI96_9ACTN
MPVSTILDRATTHLDTDDTTGGVAATSRDTAIGTACVVFGVGPADLDRATATDDAGDERGRPHRSRASTPR